MAGMPGAPWGQMGKGQRVPTMWRAMVGTGMCCRDNPAPSKGGGGSVHARVARGRWGVGLREGVRSRRHPAERQSVAHAKGHQSSANLRGSAVMIACRRDGPATASYTPKSTLRHGGCILDEHSVEKGACTNTAVPALPPRPEVGMMGYAVVWVAAVARALATAQQRAQQPARLAAGTGARVLAPRKVRPLRGAAVRAVLPHADGDALEEFFALVVGRRRQRVGL